MRCPICGPYVYPCNCDRTFMEPLLVTPKPKPTILAFTGPAGCGKSTACKMVQEMYPTFPLVVLKFAAPLKAMLTAYLAGEGITGAERDRYIEGDLKEVETDLFGGYTPRHAMQTLGTEWGRESLTNSFWTEAYARRAAVFLKAGLTVLTDDCRFANEAKTIVDLGGQVIGLPQRGTNERNPGAHKSEKGLPSFLITHRLVPAFDHPAALKAALAQHLNWNGLIA